MDPRPGAGVPHPTPRHRHGSGGGRLRTAPPLVILLALAVPLHAQSPAPAQPPAHVASPYLPLGHWAYPILDYWIATGRIDRLSPYVRPYRRADVARAVRALREREPDGAERAWAERLEEELAPELALLEGRGSAGHLALAGRGGGRYASQTHRDPLRPELEGPFSADRLLEHAFIEGRGALGSVAAGVRAGRDGTFLHDPQFPGGRVVPRKKAPLLDELGVRVEEAYVELQTRYASVFFGRLYRDWGPPALPGFVRSDYAYSEEELGYRVGTDRFFLTGSLASLPDFGGDTTRYLSMHRLEVRPLDGLVVAATEAVIHGGPAQPLVLSLVNPLGVWNIAREDGEPLRNAIGQLDVWWRPGPGVTLYGALLADATGRTPGNNFCCQMGGSVGVDVAGPVGDGRRAGGGAWLARLRASALQSLVYRTPFAWEEWSVERVGLGWDKTDLYLVSAEVEWFAPGGLLRPRLDLQWRGEGDLRAPRPSPEELADFPDILVGTVERTIRPALSGSWRPAAAVPLQLDWDLGLNLVRNHRHTPGDDRTAFVGSLRLAVETPPAILPLGRKRTPAGER